MDSKQHVAQVIREESSQYSVPDAIVEAVLDRLLPSIRMLPQHPEEADAARVGCSRIGGLPDLPSGVLWPCISAQPSSGRTHLAGQPLSFLMQLNLAEVSTLDKKQILPPRGMLYFFFRPVDLEDESDVIFATGSLSLRPLAPPVDLPQPDMFQGFALAPRLEWTVPFPYTLGLCEELVVEHLRLWDTLEGRVAEAQGFGPYYEPKHRLLGHPQLIQGPGLEEGTRLLLQVDSDCVFFDKGYPHTGMMWGDAGRIYYVIVDQELQSHRFEAANAFLEMS